MSLLALKEPWQSNLYPLLQRGMSATGRQGDFSLATTFKPSKRISVKYFFYYTEGKKYSLRAFYRYNFIYK